MSNLKPIIKGNLLTEVEVIPGTTTDIFKKVIGKANEVYVR